MSNTQPLSMPVDLASQLQLAQQQLLDTARKIKAIAFGALDTTETANLLTLYDDVRRTAAIAGTHVVDLTNAATRQALRSGAALPPDASASASAVQPVAAPPPPAAATEDLPAAAESTTVPIRPGGFLQESPST